MTSLFKPINSQELNAAMMKILSKMMISFGLVFSASGAADEGIASKYAGQESRAIKSLSANDQAELLRGGGWGLAKPAELNGYPGPSHVLAMKDQLGLNDQQTEQISALYDDMKRQAMHQADIYIGIEKALDQHFQTATITDEILRKTLNAAASARQQLRYIHLAAHLKTVHILSSEQISQYNAARGYGNSDPCTPVPKGHDAKMWRRHNGC